MTRAEIEEKVLATLAALTGAERGALGLETSRESLAAWDSLKHMHLVLALEEALDIEFDDHEVASMAEVQAVVDALVAKVAR